jgi:AbiV family abortive infection protein
MESTEYNKLTEAQAKEGFILCFENAETHYNMAVLIASKNHFPMANSHLVLAMEEATKAIFLFVKYFKNETEFDVKGLFQRHKHKHDFARENYDFFHEKVVEYLRLMQLGNYTLFTEEHFAELEKTDEIEAWSQKMWLEAFDTISKQIINLNLKESHPTIKKWFNKADKNKTRGFYVDFWNKEWKKPSEITEDDYRLSKFLSWNLILLCKSFQDSRFYKPPQAGKEDHKKNY